jgi:hypothetical protein
VTRVQIKSHLISLVSAKCVSKRYLPITRSSSNLRHGKIGSGSRIVVIRCDCCRVSRTAVRIRPRNDHEMQHWDEALPGKILRVQHEDVVNDLEGNVRRLLDFCGLDFEPACLIYR